MRFVLLCRHVCSDNYRKTGLSKKLGLQQVCRVAGERRKNNRDQGDSKAGLSICRKQWQLVQTDTLCNDQYLPTLLLDNDDAEILMSGGVAESGSPMHAISR
jgi:hypothetical protein